MRQRFNEDQAEVQAHFAERVQAYVELGETPEQAIVSAREKFGETRVVMRTLQRQRVWNSPIAWALACAVAQILAAALTHNFWISSIFTVVWLSMGRRLRKKRT